MNQWHNCPNLAAFWYNTISAVLYIYTLYTSSVRYHSSRAAMNDPRYGQDWNENYMLIHLAAILLSSLLGLFFIFSSLFKTGSLANDYVEMGTVHTIISAPHITWSISLIFRKISSRLKYHLIPFNSAIHLCGAFFLLVPIPLIIEQEVSHDIFNVENKSIHSLLTIYTPEIINFIMAAISITIRLPTVFLSVSTHISIIFSFILFVSNSNILIRCVLHQLLPLHNVTYNIIDMEMIDIVMFLLVLINYGLIYEMVRTRYIDILNRSKSQIQDQVHIKLTISTTKIPFIIRFWPNLLSTSMLTVSIILSIHQFRLSSRITALIFFDIVTAMLHYLNWLIILLIFSFKTDWHFKLALIPTNGDLLPQDFSPQFTSPVLKSPDNMYTCFQQPEAVRSVSSMSSRTPNQDFSSASSSTGSHTSERMPSYKLIPSISKQLDTTEVNYEDSSSFRSGSRQGKNLLKEIREENSEQACYFKSPNISQRSSNVHSSDSGIGIAYREHINNNMIPKLLEYDTPMSRPMNLEIHPQNEYDIRDEFSGLVNIYSDV